jgi:hypothetical protein
VGPRPLLTTAALLALGASACLGDVSPSDISAPIVVITSPSGDVVEGLVTLQATVVDDVGVDAVAFFLDDTKLVELRFEPYLYLWPSRSVPNGQHRLKVTAKDLSGNSTVVTKMIQVDNSPN